MKYRVWSHSKISLLLFWKKKAKEKVQFVIYWIDVSLDKLNVLNIVCKCPFLIHYFVLGIRAEFRLMKVVWRWWCYCSKIMKKKIHLYLDFNPLFPFSLLFIPCPKPRYNHMWSPFDFCMVSWLLIVLIWYMSKPMVITCMFWLEC